MIFHGCHGTTKIRADSIREGAFQPNKGRAGYGVYFWASEADRKTPMSKVARALAVNWFRTAKSMDRYRDEVNPKCAAIWVSGEVEPSYFLNCADFKFKALLIAFLRQPKDGIAFSTEEINAAVESAVKMIEDKQKISYSL